MRLLHAQGRMEHPYPLSERALTTTELHCCLRRATSCDVICSGMAGGKLKTQKIGGVSCYHRKIMPWQNEVCFHTHHWRRGTYDFTDCRHR
eukprot:COSAG02_NODE_11320_length_1748_cov_2.431777_1_plen_90_part_01